MLNNQRQTNIFVKLGTSCINAGVSTGIGFVFRSYFEQWQIIAIALFFLMNIVFLLCRDRREIGMLIVGSYWAERYPLWQHVVFSVFYTASFATLFIWVWFPFDIFLINMFFLQLPFVLKTGTTFHGFLSGNMRTVLK